MGGRCRRRGVSYFAPTIWKQQYDATIKWQDVSAAALLDALRENSEIIEAQALFAPVRKNVVLNANQTPVYSDIRMAGHDGGEFIFDPQ